MKKLTLILIIFICAHVKGSAQQTDNPAKTDKYIRTTGSADMEVIPDEIYLSITLREYKKDGKVVDVDMQEQQLLGVVKNMHIDSKNLTLSNAYGYYYYRHHRNADEIPTKEFQLMVSRASTIDSLFDQLDNIEITDVKVTRVDNSKMEDYRLKLKILALKAAKSKAQAMLSGIGETMGECILVQEMGSNYDEGYENDLNSFSNVRGIRDVVMERDEATVPQIDYKNIKLRYEVLAEFEIK